MSDLKHLLNELVEEQGKVLLTLARRINPSLTQEDVLQPNDFQELEYNPHFRYEEGVLAGILTVQSAIAAEEAKNFKV